MEDIPEELKFVFELPTELDSWLDKDYLNAISNDIVTLDDYVPKTIELHLPDYGARSDFVHSHPKLLHSPEFQNKQFLDQMAMGTTWEEHVSIYDEFFKKHPEFLKLIKNQDAYEKWREKEVPYYDVGKEY